MSKKKEIGIRIASFLNETLILKNSFCFVLQNISFVQRDELCSMSFYTHPLYNLCWTVTHHRCGLLTQKHIFTIPSSTDQRWFFTWRMEGSVPSGEVSQESSICKCHILAGVAGADTRIEIHLLEARAPSLLNIKARDDSSPEPLHIPNFSSASFLTD